MFERFTEPGRRSIFFAAQEARTCGSAFIETEHLLLGILHGNRFLSAQLGEEKIRKQIEPFLQRSDHPLDNSYLPLSSDSKLVLAYGAEEAEELRHSLIDANHLILGLLHVTCPATRILQQNGIELATYRQVVSQTISPPLSEDKPAAIQLKASSLRSPALALKYLLDGTAEKLNAAGDDFGEEFLKRSAWSRKEALGHLIDYATTHQQWLARALTEAELTAPSYPQETWVSVQRYAGLPWKDLVNLWLVNNRLLLHVIAQIPENKLSVSCRISVRAPISLSELIIRYVDYVEDSLRKILSRSQ